MRPAPAKSIAAAIAGIAVAVAGVHAALAAFGADGATNALIDAGANERFHVFALHEWFRPITATFLHADLTHLGVNLLWLSLLLALCGRLSLAMPLECVVVALLGGVLGQWVSVLVSPSSAIHVGASGGVYALLGLAFLRGGLRPTHDVAAWQRWSLLLIGLLAMVAQLTGAARSTGIDHVAHLAGFVGGIGLGLGSAAAEPATVWAAAFMVLASVGGLVWSTQSTAPFDHVVEEVDEAPGLALPAFGHAAWLDADGRCRRLTAPREHPVACRLVPGKLAALAGSARSLALAQPQLAELIPSSDGCTEPEHASAPRGERLLVMRRGSAVVMVTARAELWQRFGPLRYELSRGRCPDTRTQRP